jgi:hypothetical protein
VHTVAVMQCDWAVMERVYVDTLLVSAGTLGSSPQRAFLCAQAEAE